MAKQTERVSDNLIKKLEEKFQEAEFPITDLKQGVIVNGIQQTDDAVLYDRANKLGERIKSLLKQRNLTQRELANQVGVTEATISRYVKGDRIPRSTIVADIAAALNTTSDDLLGQELRKNPKAEYYQTLRTIEHNAKYWTKKQKAKLIEALFE